MSLFQLLLVKWAPDFYTELRLPVIVNCPFPVAALVNTLVFQHMLLLRRDSLLHLDRLPSQNALDALVRDLDSLADHGSVSSDVLSAHLSTIVRAESARRGYDSIITSKLLQLLPQLFDRMPTNPDLSSGTFAKDSGLHRIFDIFNTSVRHCWCVDPIDAHTLNWGDADAHDTYAVLVDTVNELRTLESINAFIDQDAGSTDQQQQQRLLQKWLDMHPRECVTDCGLHKLACGLEPGRFAALSVADRYYTVFMRERDELYVLISENRETVSSNALWHRVELLYSGDTTTYGQNFIPLLNESALMVAAADTEPRPLSPTRHVKKTHVRRERNSDNVAPPKRGKSAHCCIT